MTIFEMDFEWPVASYRLASPEEWPTILAKAEAAKRTRSLAQAALEGQEALRLEEEVQAVFDEVIATREPIGPSSEWHIVVEGPARAKKPTTRELDEALDLLVHHVGSETEHASFALKGTPEFREIILAISNRLGMLWKASEPGEYETLPSWTYTAYKLRTILSAGGFKKLNAVGSEPRQPGKFPAMADMDLVFLTKTNRPATMGFRPRRLYDALIFHAAQRAASGTRLLECEQCTTPFLSGGTRTATRKKSGARFCSAKCRADYHNARR